MRLFELSQTGPVRRALLELDPRNPIDKELSRTAKGASDAGSLDPEDQDGPLPPMDQPGQDQTDPMAGGQPEPGMEPDPQAGADAGMDDAEEVPVSKPVDSALMAKVRNHDYVQNFDHDDTTASSNPVVIMSMEMSDLSQLRNRIRVKLDQLSIQDRGGSGDPGGQGMHQEARAAQAMLSFVDLVMAHKKFQVRDQSQKAGGRPKVREVPKPKTSAGNFKPKFK